MFGLVGAYNDFLEGSSGCGMESVSGLSVSVIRGPRYEELA